MKNLAKREKLGAGWWRRGQRVLGLLSRSPRKSLQRQDPRVVHPGQGRVLPDVNCRFYRRRLYCHRHRHCSHLERVELGWDLESGLDVCRVSRAGLSGWEST